jgi:hypothetical protein
MKEDRQFASHRHTSLRVPSPPRDGMAPVLQRARCARPREEDARGFIEQAPREPVSTLGDVARLIDVTRLVAPRVKPR